VFDLPIIAGTQWACGNLIGKDEMPRFTRNGIAYRWIWIKDYL
jgi:hypothetical protein